MSIRYVHCDLFENLAHLSCPIMLPHVCNNIRLWGAGFVVPLGKHFPRAKSEYLREKVNLGQTIFVQEDNVCVANMVAQKGVKSSLNPRPLCYQSLEKCMQEVASHCYGQSIHAPMFGAGLAGGNWNIIERMIEEIWLSVDIPVFIYQL